MKLSLREETGLPIELDLDASRLILGDGLNQPSYRVRRAREHDPVWARPGDEENRTIYFYTSGLWLAEDEASWKQACVVYGIVVFHPGVFGGEYVKGAGQYHPICGNNKQATPEVYTVLRGTGHFLLQKSAPPYDAVDDAVLVEVEAGESFVVPPDYGHLQINPTSGPLVFSYAVMDGMQGVYEPFRQRRGAIYYEMAEGPERYVFNPRYGARIPLRLLKASELQQVPFLASPLTYHAIRDHLPQLGFLTDPSLFPETAHLPKDGVVLAPGAALREDAAEPGLRGPRHDKQARVKR